MKIINLLVRYIFSKNNIVMFSIIFGILFVIVSIMSKFYLNLDKQILNKEIIKNNYDYITIMIFKILIILISTYIFSLLRGNSIFTLLCISKFKFYLYKNVSNILIIALFTFLFIFMFETIPILFTKWYKFDVKNIIQITIIFLQSIVFGMISSIFTYLFKSSLSFILGYFIYIICENIMFENTFKEIINILIPIEINGIYGLIIVVMQILLYFIVGFKLYEKYENY